MGYLHLFMPLLLWTTAHGQVLYYPSTPEEELIEEGCKAGLDHPAGTQVALFEVPGAFFLPTYSENGDNYTEDCSTLIFAPDNTTTSVGRYIFILPLEDNSTVCRDILFFVNGWNPVVCLYYTMEEADITRSTNVTSISKQPAVTTIVITSISLIASILLLWGDKEPWPWGEEGGLWHFIICLCVLVIALLYDYRWLFVCIFKFMLWCAVGCRHWVYGESWLAIKDSLTHHPSSQGWAPGVLLPHCVVLSYVCVCVILVCDGGGGDVFSLYLAGNAVHNHSMHLSLSHLSLVPRPRWRQESGLVYTVCACVTDVSRSIYRKSVRKFTLVT